MRRQNSNKLADMPIAYLIWKMELEWNYSATSCLPLGRAESASAAADQNSVRHDCVLDHPLVRRMLPATDVLEVPRGNFSSPPRVAFVIPVAIALLELGLFAFWSSQCRLPEISARARRSSRKNAPGFITFVTLWRHKRMLFSDMGVNTDWAIAKSNSVSPNSTPNRSVARRLPTGRRFRS